MPEIETQIKHVPVSRIWEAVYNGCAFDETERNHILDCRKCRVTFRACVLSDTVDEAKKEIGIHAP